MYQEDMVMVKEFKNRQYELTYTKQGYWAWSGSEVPRLIRGNFLSKIEAERAWHRLEATGDTTVKPKRDNSISQLEQLDVYTKKHELVEYAEKVGVELTGTFSTASSLKKFIKSKLGAK